MSNTPSPFEKIALKFTRWLGSPSSIVIHTIIFIASFASIRFGVPIDTVLLTLTTGVSLEAIYLALFIQMTINSQSEVIKNVEEGIDEIQEDVDEIQEDIDEIQEDVDEIQEDVDEIQDDVGEISEIHHTDVLPLDQQTTLHTIYTDLKKLVEDVEKFKQQNKDS
ncbi:MAG: hypothetical protein V4519_05170 [Patescibacteria group bacterium]